MKTNIGLSCFIIFFTLLFLTVIYVIIYAVDFRGFEVIFISNWLEEFPLAPIFWIHIFTEGALVENMQWLYLALSIVFAFAVFIIRAKDKPLFSNPWIYLLIGLSIMLVEDARNIRHKTTDFLSSVVFNVETSFHVLPGLTLRTVTELVIYTIIGGIMLYAFIGIIRNKNADKTGKIFLTSGFVFYGIAAISSATRGVGDWYDRVGTNVLNSLISRSDITWSGESMIYYNSSLGFWFMDFIVEESLELMGAAFLLSSLIIFFTTQYHHTYPPAKTSQ